MANAPDGVGWLLMPQLDIAATTASSLSEMMSNFDRKHCCMERSRSSSLMAMQCICFSIVTRSKADAGQTAAGQPEELELVMINMTNAWLKPMKYV